MKLKQTNNLKFDTHLKIIKKANFPELVNDINIDYKKLAHSIADNHKTYRKRFLVYKGNSYFLLKTNDISCIQIDLGRVIAINNQGKQFVLNDTPLDRLEEQLNPNTFFRINSQNIIHINAIEQVEPYFNGRLIVKLSDHLDLKLVMSRAKTSFFIKWMDS
jgi:DNA-binding LytR/AlgR family response regulator